jgi:predicted site-specific integrase-resolvase
MDNEYVEKMKEWIEMDNVSSVLRQQISKLNDKKKELEDDILKYVEENNLEKVVVTVSDGTLKFPKRSQQQAISLKFLKSNLSKYNDEKEHINVEEVFKFLTSNLETKTKLSIKRDVR